MHSKIGRYEIVRQIGQGGMGTVYAARHTKLDKIVALKVLPIHNAVDKELIARFEREMRAVGQVKHAGFVRALDADEADGFLYIAMELVEGFDLACCLKRSSTNNRLPVPVACEIVRQASLAIYHANCNGLVHRDLKPSNLMLTPKGQTIVLDLGLASFTNQTADATTKLTAGGQVMGTIDYMSPEQALGQHGIDHRTDIYALGATLYHLLSGDVLFPNSMFPTMFRKLQAIAHDRPYDFEVRSENWPAKLKQILSNALEKEPERRQANAKILAEQLTEFADFEAVLVWLDEHRGQDPFRTLLSDDEPTAALLPSNSKSHPTKPPARRWFAQAMIALVALVAAGLWRMLVSKSNRSGIQAEVTDNGRNALEDTTPFGSDVEAARWIVSKGGRFVAQRGKSDEMVLLNSTNDDEHVRFLLWGITWTGRDLSPSDLKRFRNCRFISMLHLETERLSNAHITAITQIHSGDALVLRPREPYSMPESVLAELLSNAKFYWALGFRNIYGNSFDLGLLKDKASLTYLMIAGEKNLDPSNAPRIDKHCIESIGQFRNLISLDIRHSLIEAADCQPLFSSSALSHLYIGGPHSPKILNQMPIHLKLRKLEIDGCDLSKAYDRLLQMRSLRHLSLIGCEVTRLQLETLTQTLPECYIVSDNGKFGKQTLKPDFGERWFYPDDNGQ